MLIALDYDGTYTEDPQLWDRFIQSVKRAGHEIVCVTMRYESAAVDLPVPVYYTRWKAKGPFMEALGLHVDVWIDDNPGWVLFDAATACAVKES